MKESLIIIGAGGHGRDLLSLLTNCYFWDRSMFLGFLDDDTTKIASDIDVLGPISEYTRYMSRRGDHLKYAIGINDPAERKRICEYMDSIHARPANIIHNTASIGYQSFYRDGLVMGPYSVITGFVTLGRHVHLNSGASVNQSSDIGDFCTLSPGVRVCGDVRVGDTTYLGANSTVINTKKVGSNVTIGAGGVVVKDIPDNVVAVGVPAQTIKVKDNA